MVSELSTVYDIKLPQFNDDDYIARLEEADIDKDLIQIEYNLLPLTRKSKSEALSPYHIGWHILWSNAFHLTRAARDSLVLPSFYTLHALNRVILELNQITRAIGVGLDDQQDEISNEHIRDRLSAYFGWCIWQDIRYIEHLLQGNVQSQLWDERPRQELANDPVELERFESIYGPLEQLSPKELSEMREKYRVNFWRQADNLKAMAEHRDVSIWLDEIVGDWEPGYTYRSFFELLKRRKYGFSKMLKESNLNLFSPEYESGSQLIHCSTFSQLFYHDKREIIPKSPDDENEMKLSTDKFISTCKSTFVLLNLLRISINSS